MNYQRYFGIVVTFCFTLVKYFGKHRALGRRNDNPDLKQLGYQTNTLRIQRSVASSDCNWTRTHNQKKNPENHRFSAGFQEKRKSICSNSPNNILTCSTKARCWYSEDVNKNPV